ncbi:MAG: ribbon-helix-helix protein, CopG family [Planctomycetales bacterium]
MKTVSLRLSASLDSRLAEAARRRGTTKSALAREALATFLETGASARRLSTYDLAKDLCGSLEGPGDLSYNKEHMEGFGE